VFSLGTQAINSQGHLEIGGCDAVELAQTFATPLIVMDEAHIRGQMRAMKGAFEAQNVDIHVIYASKAFPCLAFLKLRRRKGLWIDVARRASFSLQFAPISPPNGSFFTATTKSDEELEMAVGAGIGRVIVDNFDEMERLNRIAGEAGTRHPSCCASLPL
jgi:diaminopimelate decarboxylase